jgi:isoleucyl-tRNA synthetase
MGLEVQDKIHIKVEKDGSLMNEAIRTHKDYICTETQALSLDVVEKLTEDASLLDLDDQQLRVKIEA